MWRGSRFSVFSVGLQSLVGLLWTKIILHIEGDSLRLELVGAEKDDSYWPEEEYQLLLKWCPVLVWAYALLMQEEPTTIAATRQDATDRIREQEAELD
jgi:hypothetical protein